jgi:hypothetical protein
MIMERRIVCAANKDISGMIVLGVRHFDEHMLKVLKLAKLPRFSLIGVQQGFIDQRGVFLSREEAWLVAEAAGQIIRRVGGDMSADGVGKLFSENLY